VYNRTMILDADFATIQFQQPASISLKTGQQAQVLKQKLVQIHVQKRFRLCSSDRIILPLVVPLFSAFLRKANNSHQINI
jgi:hypothetical protein